MRNDGKIAHEMMRDPGFQRKIATKPARLLLLVWVALCGAGVPRAAAQEYDVTVALGWHRYVPVMGPSRDLDPGFAPFVSVSVAPETSRLRFLGRGGVSYLTEDEAEDTVATLAPFLVGVEYTLLREGRISAVAQLLGGAVWLKIRNLEEDKGPPFERSWSTSRYLRVAGSTALLLKLAVTEILSFESGVALDVIAFEESQYPGFLAFSAGIAAHF